jgi:dihydrofolate reductase
MKTIAYFTLTADGFLPRAEEKGLPSFDQVVTDSMKIARKAGGLIVGRTTWESMEEDESPVPVVVVSKSMPKKEDGAMVARSPVEALRMLEDKGFEGALVGGGAQLYSSFLAQDLVDELYVNIAPDLLGKGLRIEGPRRHAEMLKLMRRTPLEEGVTQLHYRRA